MIHFLLFPLRLAAYLAGIFWGGFRVFIGIGALMLMLAAFPLVFLFPPAGIVLMILAGLILKVASWPR